MKSTTRRQVLLAAIALAASTVVQAQGWPSKPLRIVVPYPPGGSSDIIARAISQPLAEALKQTVIVENKAGANGNTGTDFVAKPNDGQAVAGQTQVLMNGMLATLPHVQSGKLKAIGVSKAARVAQLPNVPTIAEQGVKGFESGSWQGVLVPASMPADVVARLAAELTRIIRLPEVQERLASQGADVYTMTPGEFTTFFERERKHWAAVVAQGGVKVD